jgi:hypothetical protein
VTLVTHPDGHRPLQQQEHLIVVAVDVDGRGVTATRVGVDDRQLPAGDRRVQQDGQLTAAV